MVAIVSIIIFILSFAILMLGMTFERMIKKDKEVFGKSTAFMKRIGYLLYLLGIIGLLVTLFLFIIM